MLKPLLKRFLASDTEEERFHHTFNEVLVEGGFLRDLSGTLLDVGARDGAFDEQLLLALERDSSDPASVRATLKVVIVDINPRYLAEARRRFPAVAADMEKTGLPFASGTVSCVVLNQLLEHLKDPFRMLAEADRVLKTGGVLAIGVPNLAGWVNRFYLLLGKQPPAIHFPGPHVRGFTWRSLNAFLRTNPNFRMERAFGSCAYPLPPPLCEWWGKRWPGGACYMFFVMRKAANVQPSVWLSPRTETGETVFG